MIEAFLDAVARDPHYAQTTNLVVLRDAELVLERHFGDDSAESLADVYSVTKSVADDCFFAGGYAGQALVVVPAESLVVVATGTEERLAPGWRNARHALAEALA